MVVEVGLATPGGALQSRHIGLDKIKVIEEGGSCVTTLAVVYQRCQDLIYGINQQEQGLVPLSPMDLFCEHVLRGNRALIFISGLHLTSSTYLPAVFMSNAWSSPLDARDWSAQLVYQNHNPVVFQMRRFQDFCTTRLQAAKAAGEQSRQFLRRSQLQGAQQRTSVATASGAGPDQNIARPQRAQGVVPPQTGSPTSAATRPLPAVTAVPVPTVTGMPGSGVQPHAIPGRGSNGAPSRTGQRRKQCW